MVRTPYNGERLYGHDEHVLMKAQRNLALTFVIGMKKTATAMMLHAGVNRGQARTAAAVYCIDYIVQEWIHNAARAPLRPLRASKERIQLHIMKGAEIVVPRFGAQAIYLVMPRATYFVQCRANCPVLLCA